MQEKEGALRPRARLRNLAGRMNWMRGLRAAVALCAPLVVGQLLHWDGMGWAALGGFEATLADQGGPYRTRLEALAMLALGGSAALFSGELFGTSLAWALTATMLGCFAWSYLGVLGQPFSTAGVLVQVIYFCGVGAPATGWREALGPALLMLAGAGWAAVLGLLLWPLDANRPARAAVADCYRALERFAGSVAELAAREEQPAELWQRLAKHHQFRVRQAVERGWAAVAGLRVRRQADSAVEQHLVVLLEHADLLIARTVALAEHLEAQAGNGKTACLERSLAGLADLRAVELWLADLLERRQGQTAAHAQARRSQMQRLPAFLGGCGEGFLEAQIVAAASLLDSSVKSVAALRLGWTADQGAGEAADRELSSGHFGYVHERLGGLRRQWHAGRIADELRANLTPNSLMARHAARVALVCGLEVGLIFGLHVDHGYWLMLTSLIVLQPYVSGTLRRGAERIGGTVGGGALAAVLALGLHSQLATAAVLFPLALLALAVMPVSYAAFSFFLTPAFVLAWLPYSGDWRLAVVRTVNTVLGAGLAVAATLFLFPSYERERAPEFLRTSLRANRNYLEALCRSWASGGGGSRPLAQARRAAGLAHNDTEESLERLLTENWSRRLPFAEFATAFMTYLRRFTQSVTTLAALEGEREWKRSDEVRRRLELAAGRLAWLEAETAGGAKTAWPEGETAAEDGQHAGERLLGRLERQVEVLRRHLGAAGAQGMPAGPRTES